MPQRNAVFFSFAQYISPLGVELSTKVIEKPKSTGAIE
jgi:hypothetical protein